ncbi:beta subunit of fatty acid synthetase [Puccinia graminis f. sp. tritici]|uniref:Beta subunit of fatty acid synthetase n=1 Tax=Puccinia graminis f. sp. tritici TaxID=56615 RepID=A0A5B0S8G1_PUCGR|nr:beta subunit of fatty acid synthetase [Puccinia graminis f. sp. tritici]
MMPFDGVLFASRMMVAKEAATSQSVKDLIVQAKGVDDQEWEGTYDRETGGIITVTSELGEPIHKIATRGIKLWKEFDETVFALPREKRAAWLESHKDYVIKRLNADFQKPWFAEKDGQPAELGDMTYQETVHRLVRLLFVKHQSRWIDPTLRNLGFDELKNDCRSSMDPPKVSEIQSYSELDEPFSKLETFFIDILRPGLSALANLQWGYIHTGFKKDSLWQAEDIDAVVDQDPQRVAILQGPVAVRHSTTTEETAEEILRGIEDGVVKRLLTDVYGGDEGSVPEQDYLCRQGAEMKEEERTAMLATARIKYRMETPSADRLLHTYDIDGLLPPPSQWLACLAGSSVSGSPPSLTPSPSSKAPPTSITSSKISSNLNTISAFKCSLIVAEHRYLSQPSHI